MMKNYMICRVVICRAAMITIGLLMTIAKPLAAQDMPRTVVGNAGDYYEALQFGNLHWTVGEVAVSLHQNVIELHEGFHQSYYELIVSTEDLSPDWELSIYPNPTANFLQLKFAEEDQLLNAQLLGSTGQLLINKENLQGEEEFDLRNFPAGCYWLRILAADGRQQTFKVLKVER